MPEKVCPLCYSTGACEARAMFENQVGCIAFPGLGTMSLEVLRDMRDRYYNEGIINAKCQSPEILQAALNWLDGRIAELSSGAGSTK